MATFTHRSSSKICQHIYNCQGVAGSSIEPFPNFRRTFIAAHPSSMALGAGRLEVEAPKRFVSHNCSNVTICDW
jgi:hypothetical protein